MTANGTWAAAADRRATIISELNDPQFVARFVLKELFEGRLDRHSVAPLLKYVFMGRGLLEFHGHLIAYMIVAGREPAIDRIVAGNPALQGSYRMVGAWVRTCVLDGEMTMPPVSGTQGMAFIATVMDAAELHLRSIRALDAAARIAALRGMIDSAFARKSARWVLASSFVSHIGHFVYASALLEMQRRGRIADRNMAILDGASQNIYLRSFYAPHLCDRMPEGCEYVEMISARKRHHMADGSWQTTSEVVSAAAEVWAGGNPFLTLDQATRERGDAALSALGVPRDAPVVTLHVREGDHGTTLGRAMSLRDGQVDDYREAIAYLAGQGAYVVRLGDVGMTRAEALPHFVDYPFSDAKSEWMDIYLVERCRFHIGTSSGMSFVPLLFGRPTLFTNWITLSHMVCASNVVTLPRVLLDPAGATVPISDYCDRHGHILERADATLHGLSFRRHDPAEIADAVRLMHEHIDPASGRLVLPAGTFEVGEAVFAASSLNSRPQIPPAFWQRHYADGQPATGSNTSFGLGSRGSGTTSAMPAIDRRP